MKEKHEAIQDLDEQRAAVTEKLHKLERQHDHTLSEYERARESFSMRAQQNKEEIAALQVSLETKFEKNRCYEVGFYS